jgi:hypothetical protein
MNVEYMLVGRESGARVYALVSKRRLVCAPQGGELSEKEDAAIETIRHEFFINGSPERADMALDRAILDGVFEIQSSAPCS